MLNRRTINKQFKALLFPKFSEIQYFALIVGVVMLFVLSPVVRLEVSSLLKNTAPEYFIYLAFFSLYLFVLFILPVLLAIVMVSKIRLSPRLSYIACSFYYAIYCILAACSIGPQIDLLHGSSNILLTVNLGMSVVIFGVLIARYFTWHFTFKLNSPKLTALYASRLKSRQYRLADFVFVLGSTAIMMRLLSIVYSQPAVLAFLTVTYTLLAYKAYELALNRATPLLK